MATVTVEQYIGHQYQSKPFTGRNGLAGIGAEQRQLIPCHGPLCKGKDLMPSYRQSMGKPCVMCEDAIIRKQVIV